MPSVALAKESAKAAAAGVPASCGMHLAQYDCRDGAKVSNWGDLGIAREDKPSGQPCC